MTGLGVAMPGGSNVCGVWSGVLLLGVFAAIAGVATDPDPLVAT